MPASTGSLGDSYYARLEVGQGASHDDIVHAYRRLAMGAHPDAHPDDPDAAGRFRDITEAYEILGDPKRRADYDRQLGGVRLHVRGEGDDRRETIGGGHHEGEPVVLGSARRRGGSPFRAGPVLHEGMTSQDRGAGLQADRSPSDVSQLLRRIVGLWGEP